MTSTRIGDRLANEDSNSSRRYAAPMYTAFHTDRTGQPWEDFEDAMLWDDVRWGCTDLHTLALRLRRSPAEVLQRGNELKPPGWPTDRLKR